MAKKNVEVTFGTRIQNAQNLITILQTFTNYVPLRQEDSVDDMKKLIKTIQNTNNAEANYLQAYTLAVDVRQKTFNGEDTSIKTIVTPIIATLRAQYGKDSKEVTSLSELIKKIRGTSTRKEKTNVDEKSISTSQQSYASLTQNFADLIASLEALKPKFVPTNPILLPEALKEKLDIIRKATDDLTSSFIALDKERKTRNILYLELTQRTQRIKESVKAQYGVKSTEYASVKGLKI